MGDTNMRILKRLGYFVAEAEWGTHVIQLCSPDGEVINWTTPSSKYTDLEEWLFLRAPQIDPFYLVKGVRWTADYVPDRSSWGSYPAEDYEVFVEDGFGEADTLEEAICAAWLDYMERNDRREQKGGINENNKTGN